MADLQAPGFDRLWRETRRKWQRRGPAGGARVELNDLTQEEVHALDGLPRPGRYRPLVPGGRFRIELTDLEAALAEHGETLTSVLERHGGPVADVAVERRAARAARTELLDSLAQLVDALGHPELRDWLASSPRVSLEDGDRLRLALTIAGQLLAGIEPVDRAVFAARACAGDSHALDPGTALEHQVRRLLQHVDGCADADLSALGTRRLYERFGVHPDLTASTVLTLGLPGDERTACGRLLAACPGHATVLPYGLLRDDPPSWTTGLEVFVCENPSVVHTAQRELGRRCAPLVCTAGWPGSAAQLLLGSARDAGVTLRHHADFDAEGLGMHEMLRTKYGASAWRFGAAEYRAAVTTAAGPLPPIRLGSADGELGAAMLERKVQVVEELVIDHLMADLRKPR